MCSGIMNISLVSGFRSSSDYLNVLLFRLRIFQDSLRMFSCSLVRRSSMFFPRISLYISRFFRLHPYHRQDLSPLFHLLFLVVGCKFVRLSKFAFVTTVTELKAIAASAITGWARPIIANGIMTML